MTPADFLQSAMNIRAAAPKIDLIEIQASVLMLLVEHLREMESATIDEALVLIDESLGKPRRK